MKIIIDNSNLYVGGGIQVATSFLKDLQNINSHLDFYYVIQSPNSAKEINENDFDKNKFKFFYLPQNLSKFKRSGYLKSLEQKIDADVVFTVFGPSYHKSSIPKIVGFAIPHIIYPDSPFFSKISINEKLSLYVLNKFKEYMFKRNSNALIFESEYARKFFESKISNKIPTYCVNNTLNEIFIQPERWTNISIEKKKSFNILCVSANYLHKNLSIIPQVIDVLIDNFKIYDFTFHITLKREDLNFEKKYDKYINYLGKVELSKLPNLYNKMQLLFMPTLLEVFSTTYLEAMFMKIPIVASDMPFAHDICSNAALYCKPTDSKDYAAKIFQIYSVPDVGKKLIFNGSKNILRFGNSMDRTKKYLQIIENLLHENKK